MQLFYKTFLAWRFCSCCALHTKLMTSVSISSQWHVLCQLKECGKCQSSSVVAVHRLHHSVEKPFECTFCSKPFTTSGDLVRHSRIHSGEKLYKCHNCDKTFSDSGHQITHVRVHTGDRFSELQLTSTCTSTWRCEAVCLQWMSQVFLWSI